MSPLLYKFDNNVAFKKSPRSNNTIKLNMNNFAFKNHGKFPPPPHCPIGYGSDH